MATFLMLAQCLHYCVTSINYGTSGSQDGMLRILVLLEVTQFMINEIRIL